MARPGTLSSKRRGLLSRVVGQPARKEGLMSRIIGIDLGTTRPGEERAP